MPAGVLRRDLGKLGDDLARGALRLFRPPASVARARARGRGNAAAATKTPCSRRDSAAAHRRARIRPSPARRARRARCCGRSPNGMLELRELALPREHAVQVAVRREEVDRLRGDEMAARRDEGFARPPSVPRSRSAAPTSSRQRTPRSQSERRRAISGRSERTRRKQAVAASTVASHFRLLRARCGGRIERDPRRSQPAPSVPLRTPALRGLEAVQLDRIEPFAQHGLERVLPAGLDVESLPQAAGAWRCRGRRAIARCPCPARSSPAARRAPAIGPRCPRARARPFARRRSPPAAGPAVPAPCRAAHSIRPLSRRAPTVSCRS